MANVTRNGESLTVLDGGGKMLMGSFSFLTTETSGTLVLANPLSRIKAAFVNPTTAAADIPCVALGTADADGLFTITNASVTVGRNAGTTTGLTCTYIIIGY